MNSKTPLILGLTQHTPFGKTILSLFAITLLKKVLIESSLVKNLSTPLGIAKKDIIYIGKLLSTELISVCRKVFSFPTAVTFLKTFFYSFPICI
jgi:hypothetical protein